MKTYLTVDFGSTFTKLTAIDIDNCEILATSLSPTTVTTDIIEGYNNALENLYEKLGKNIKFDYISASSSAAGGLKIIAIGLVPSLTVEAAKKASLTAGGKVIDTYSFELSEDDAEKIKNSEADILILSGGTDGGNKEYIINNLKKLVDAKISVPLIICGNNEAVPEIEKILENENLEVYITENVMPVVNKLNVYPVRETIRKVFLKNIVNAEGMQNFQKQLGKIILPTPAAVLYAAELLANGTENEEGIGELMVVDIGGATTDVHSVADGLPSKNNIILKGLEEPYSKRTVEGDLGMRYSAVSLYEATTLNKIRTYLGEKDSKINVRESFVYRQQNPDYIADNEFDIKFDNVMAKLCTEIAVNRHAGTLECVFSPMGTIFTQTGKDLTNIKNVIGTGGSIIRSSDPEFILSSAAMSEDDELTLKPKFPTYFLDKTYILAAMGILSKDFPDVALKILKKYIVKI